MNFKKPNIIFMGTAGFGIPTLDLINKNYNLKGKEKNIYFDFKITLLT